jgi:hypothetical protein
MFDVLAVLVEMHGLLPHTNYSAQSQAVEAVACFASMSKSNFQAYRLRMDKSVTALVVPKATKGCDASF